MGLDPSPTPLAHGAIGGANGRSDLLVALFGMRVGRENDPSTHHQRLGRAVRSNELFKLLGFIRR